MKKEEITKELLSRLLNETVTKFKIAKNGVWYGSENSGFLYFEELEELHKIKEQMKSDFKLMCEANGVDFLKVDYDQVEKDNLELFKKHLDKQGDISEFEYIKQKEDK